MKWMLILSKVCNTSFTKKSPNAFYLLRVRRSRFVYSIVCLRNPIEDLSGHWFFMEISCPPRGYVCQWPDIWEEIGTKLVSIDSDNEKKGRHLTVQENHRKGTSMMDWWMRGHNFFTMAKIALHNSSSSFISNNFISSWSDVSLRDDCCLKWKF